jgi:hypothetical protein
MKRSTALSAPDMANVLNFEMTEMNGSGGDSELEPLTAKPLDVV